MKVCVFGAGAIGGHAATRLIAAKAAEVSVVTRGVQLEAIRARGLKLLTGGREITGRPAAATDDPSTLPPQDVVIVTLKAHSLPGVADSLARLAAPQGSIVFVLNGIPWWWRLGLPGAAGPLPLLDPEGAIWTRVREKTLGCVVYGPVEVQEPGVIFHFSGNRWLIGEPDGSKSARLKSVVDLFNAGGLVAEIPEDLRREVWRKAFGNVAGNTLAALTRLRGSEFGAVPGLQDVFAGLMRETLEVAAALGWDLRPEIEVDKVARRSEPSRFRSSMLQDVQAGRPLETEALLGQVQAFARETRVAVPFIDAIVPLLRGLDRSLRLKDG
ncbi:MAG TPA: 2-dehydropantoate 2-reductase [Burkholderiales bacterium]|jgi:2-dehydropantoate 2-reductase|nr:2-dehydropantoate 2-reductase [Burkholderiales bacterium]